MDMEIATERFRSRLAPKPIPFARPTSSDESFSEDSFNEDELLDDVDELNATDNGSGNDSGRSLIRAPLSYDLEDFVYDDCMEPIFDCKFEFHSKVAKVSQRIRLSVVDDEDAQSLMGTLLPLMCEEAKEMKAFVEDAGDFGTPPQMPLAKLTADDDEELQSEEEVEESVEEGDEQLDEEAEDGGRAHFPGLELVTACHQLSGTKYINSAISIEGIGFTVDSHPQRSLPWDELQKTKANGQANIREYLTDAVAACFPNVKSPPATETSDEMQVKVTRTLSAETGTKGSDETGPVTEKSVGRFTGPCEIIVVNETDAASTEVVNVKNELESIRNLDMTVSLHTKSKDGQPQVPAKNIYPFDCALTEIHSKSEVKPFFVESVVSAAEAQPKPGDSSLVEGIQSEGLGEPMESIVKVVEDIVPAKKGASENIKSRRNVIAKQYNVDNGKEIGGGSFRGLEPQYGVTAEDDIIETLEEADDMQQKINVEENKDSMHSLSAHADSMEQDRFNLDFQNLQNCQEYKEGVHLRQRQLLELFKAKENMNSELSVAGGDAGAKVQDYETLQSDASDDLDAVDDLTRKNIEANTECICSGGQDATQNAVLEEAMNFNTQSLYKLEASSGTDAYLQKACRKLITDLDVEVTDDHREEDEEIVVSSVLPLFFEAANSAGIETNNASSGAAGFSVSTCPASQGSSVPSFEPVPRSVQHSQENRPVSTLPSVLAEDSQCSVDQIDSNGDTQEKLQIIRLKFLRLAYRLGQTSRNAVVAQVLYRLGLAEQLRGSRDSNRAFTVSYDRACAIAEEQEAAGQESLDLTCTILVLGKTGVGKSATINSILGEAKTATDAFHPATNKVEEIVGTVHGVKIRIIDTPGLRPCFADKRRNEKIMLSVKKFIKKCPPDIVLYFDRLDMQCRDHSDISLMKFITNNFGSAIWFNTTVVLTHSSLDPPDGADGSPLNYEMYVAQCSHFVQHSIRQAAGDSRLINPVSLIENHSSCRTNRKGEKLLPNGEAWEPQLLLLCFASKILGEANAVLKLQDTVPGRQLGVRSRVPPLPYLLSSLLQSRVQPKMAYEQLGAEVKSDEDLEDLSDLEDGDDYDQLPPFKHLTKYQLSKLSKEQRKAYFDELDYREKLFQKKQWREELIRQKSLKNMLQDSKDKFKPMNENFVEENAGAGAVPVPMPDMVMPPTFDSDNPTYRYRYFDMANQWLVSPVLEIHGWDHDIGFDGLNVEKMFVIGNRIPASISGQLNKDKKEANIQLECAASLKHREGKVTLAGFDVQTVGKDVAYTFRGETNFRNFKRNKTGGGFGLTFLGDTLAAGMKIEDRLTIGKRFKFVLNGGAMMGNGEVAFGGSLEAILREKDYPVGQMLTTLGISIMDWHGDLAVGSNLESQFLLGRKLMMVTRANLNNRGSGQISIRTSSTEQLQIAMIGIIPLIRALIGRKVLDHS